MVGGCAKMGPPPGGPEDKKPPQVLRTDPEEGSINVSVDKEITFWFDERIERATLANAFTCSPPPPGEVRADWTGYKQVTLEFDPPLLDDRTYVITLGTELQDLRRNKGEESFHLAFATGNQLDQGLIKGKLFVPSGSDPVGWFVNAYYLGMGLAKSENPYPFDPADSLAPDPAYDLPDASTQAGKEGVWELRNLKSGWWRVFAFQDGDRDRLWTPKRESLAIPPSDVFVFAEKSTAPDSTGEEKKTRPSGYTSSPYLALTGYAPVRHPYPDKLYTRTRNIVQVRFSPKLTSLDSVTFTPERGLEISQIHFDPVDSTRIWLHMSEPIEDDSLFMKVQATFEDTIHIDTTLAMAIATVVEADTFAPMFATTRPSSDIRLRPGQKSIRFIFNEPMAPPPNQLVTLFTRNDTLSRSMLSDDLCSWDFRLPADSLLAPRFTVEFPGSTVTDVAGNALEDSLVSIRFNFIHADSLGIVSGSVDGAGFEDGSWQGDIHLTMRNVIESSQDTPFYRILEQAGDFKIEGVPAGMWRLSGWIDLDGDGKLSHGWTKPYQPADLFFESSDTVFVRARWESAENVLTFPK